jgi:hypothetical protein
MSGPEHDASSPAPAEAAVAGAQAAWVAASGAGSTWVSALRQSGPVVSAQVLGRLQHAHGNAAVGRMIARAPRTPYTIEEKILDEILHDKRPERLRELFAAVPTEKAKVLVATRLAEGTKDAFGVRFHADLPQALRTELLGILKAKYEPAPPAPAATPAPPPAVPGEPIEFEFEADGTLVTIHTPSDPNYIDKRVSQVISGFVYPGQYSLLLDGVKLPGTMSNLDFPGFMKGKTPPVAVDPKQLDILRTASAPVRQAPYPDKDSALAAVAEREAKNPGALYHAYYKGNVNLIVPTVFSPATTPRMIQMITGTEVVRGEEADAAAAMFTEMAVGMALAIIAGELGGAAVRAGLKKLETVPPPKPPPPGKRAPATPKPPAPAPDPDAEPITVRPGKPAPFQIDKPKINVGPDEVRATWTGDDRAVVAFTQTPDGGVSINYINAGNQQGQGAKLLGNALRGAATELGKPGLAKPKYLDSSNVVNQHIKPMVTEGRIAEAQAIVQRASRSYARELGGTAGTPELTLTGTGDNAKVTVKVPINY